MGATITVAGGYGANVSGSTNANGYYALSIKPINIGGPFALNFAIASDYGNYSTIQGNITVTAPIVVPVDKVLAGTVIAGQTGTMPNRGSEEYGGWRRADVSYPSASGRVHLKIPLGAYLTGTPQQGGQLGVFSDDPNFIPSNLLSGKTYFGMAGGIPNNYGVWQYSLAAYPGEGRIHLYPPAGYYDGNSGTGVYFDDPNFTASNIKSGVNIFGINGTYSSTPTHGSQIYSTPGTYSFTVPSAVNSVFALVTGGGGGGGSGYGSGSYTGSGGGGGGTTINSIAVTPGQVLTVIVGAGGTGGIANQNWTTGLAGGTSSVGGLSATGGNGGMNALYGSGYGGSGGTGTGFGSNGGTGAMSLNAPPYVSVGGSSGGYGGSGLGGNGQRVGNGINGANGSVVILW